MSWTLLFMQARFVQLKSRAVLVVAAFIGIQVTFLLCYLV